MFTERLETLRAQLTELARLSCNYKLNLLGLLRWGLSTISPARQAGSTSIMLLTPFWWPLIKNTKISWTILNLSLSLSLSLSLTYFIYLFIPVTFVFIFFYIFTIKISYLYKTFIYLTSNISIRLNTVLITYFTFCSVKTNQNSQ